ncbi:hypothetical protein RDI58_010633 [Solanum bulbocastanum]|uniref:DUF4283 domain-containing protein n=1 Tax=Solanum bulbocastanum TaxID=147425 RepID=A0AAN8TU92_SOLBU
MPSIANTEIGARNIENYLSNISPKKDVIQDWFVGKWQATEGGILTLEWWSLVAGSALMVQKSENAWIRALGVPIHALSFETSSFIRDKCGGFIGIDEDTTLNLSLLGSNLCWEQHTRNSEAIRDSKRDGGYEVMILEDLHTKIRLAGRNNAGKKGIWDTRVTGLKNPQQLPAKTIADSLLKNLPSDADDEGY